jgi:hypothetical protein
VNQAAGNAARDAIAARYTGSQTEVTFNTALGARSVDVLTSVMGLRRAVARDRRFRGFVKRFG